MLVDEDMDNKKQLKTKPAVVSIGNKRLENCETPTVITNETTVNAKKEAQDLENCTLDDDEEDLEDWLDSVL